MAGLSAEGAQVLAALEAYIKRSEDRLAYRQKAGRGLSKAHQKQLRELRDRLDALLTPPLPPAEPAKLLADFRALTVELDGTEGGESCRG